MSATTRTGRQNVVHRYSAWSENWGLTLAFSITQSLEVAEKVVAEAVVAMIAVEVPKIKSPFLNEKKKKEEKSDLPPVSVQAVRFASVIWDLCQKDAFRGFGADTFFKMTALTRAIVVLKTKAKLSRSQIAAALHLNVAQVDDHLESSRLLHTGGKPWLGETASQQVAGTRVVPECPHWDKDKINIQNLFANYVEKDLKPEDEARLHKHFVVCSACRSSLAKFKENYSTWENSFPVFEPDEATSKHLKSVSKMAVRRSRYQAPSVIPGIKKTLSSPTVQAYLFGVISILFIIHAILRITS